MALPQNQLLGLNLTEQRIYLGLHLLLQPCIYAPMPRLLQTIIELLTHLLQLL